jgi:hypothetical protein
MLDNIDDLEHEGDTLWRMDAETGSEEHGATIHVNHPKTSGERDMEMTGYFKLIDSDEGDLEINGDGDCDRNEDYVIDEGQPRATFRLDDSESEFKYLSIGEKAIQ